MNCPNCRSPLFTSAVGRAQVQACRDCGGALAPTHQLVPLLEGIAGSMLRELDVDAEVEKVPPPATSTRCPSCSAVMERFGYMGSPLVHLDRCGSEMLIWADGEAIGTAALLYARTHRRVMLRKEKDDALREQWAQSSRARGAGRLAVQQFTAGLILGGAIGGIAVVAAQEALKKR